MGAAHLPGLKTITEIKGREGEREEERDRGEEEEGGRKEEERKKEEDEEEKGSKARERKYKICVIDLFILHE